MLRFVSPSKPVPLGLANSIVRDIYTPFSLGSSLLAWWSAGRADLVGAGSFRDAKAGNDAVQATEGARPAWSATSFNGAPGFTHDGTDDELTYGAMPFPSGANPLEVWAVCQQDAPAGSAGTRILISWGGTTNATRGSLGRVVVSGVNRFRGFVGDGATAVAVAHTSVDASSRHVVRLQIGATQSAITVDNGTPETQAVVPAIGASQVRIGAITSGTAALFWQGEFSDIMFTQPLSAANASLQWGFLMPRRML